MTRRTLSLVLVIAGALLALVSLLADLVGIGSYPGYHWAQITGAILGVVALVIGVWLRRKA